jgi:hypothetical protein
MGLSAKAWIGDSVASKWHAAGFTPSEYGAWRDFASVNGLDVAAEWHNEGYSAWEAANLSEHYASAASAAWARRHADDVEISNYDRADDDAAWMTGESRREGWF